MKQNKTIIYFAGFLFAAIVFSILQFSTPQPNLIWNWILFSQINLAVMAFFLLLHLVYKQKLSVYLLACCGALTLVVVFFVASIISNLRILNRLCEPGTIWNDEFSIATIDGVQLAGITAQNGHDQAVIILHGAADNKNGCELLATGEALSKYFDVYLLDFRGYGHSRGQATFGYLEILDVEAIFNYVTGKHYTSIGIIGNSMGGMVATRFAAQEQRVGAVVIVGTPASYEPTTGGDVENLAPLLLNKIGRLIYLMFTQVKISDKVSEIYSEQARQLAPIYLINQITPTPILIVHGSQDTQVPIENAQILFANAEEPKNLLIYEGGGHSITALSAQFGADFYRDISTWLMINLK